MKPEKVIRLISKAHYHDRLNLAQRLANNCASTVAMYIMARRASRLIAWRIHSQSNCLCHNVTVESFSNVSLLNFYLHIPD